MPIKKSLNKQQQQQQTLIYFDLFFCCFLFLLNTGNQLCCMESFSSIRLSKLGQSASAIFISLSLYLGKSSSLSQSVPQKPLFASPQTTYKGFNHEGLGGCIQSVHSICWCQADGDHVRVKLTLHAMWARTGFTLNFLLPPSCHFPSARVVFHACQLASRLLSL